MITDGLRIILLHALQFGIGVVWIAAAVGKARTPAILREDIRKLVGGTTWLVAAIMLVLPPAELILGVMLIAGWQTAAVALVSAVLFFLFAFLIGRAAVLDAIANVSGNAGCGCFGARPQALSSGPLNLAAPQLVARNFLLATLALVVAAADCGACMMK